MALEDIHRPLSTAGFRGAIKWIIILCTVMLVLEQFWGGPLIYFLGLTPAKVWQDHWWWQIFTYLFLHGGFFHWLFNMFILWMFGRELEVRWGTLEFLRYFFITGIGAAFCLLALAPRQTIPTIGASGAIYGMIVAFAMLFPEAVLYFYFLIPLTARQAAVLCAFIEFFASLQPTGSRFTPLAHLGGMLTGYLYLKLRMGTLWAFTNPFPAWWSRLARRGRKRIRLHEVSDDLVSEVDRILDKILRDGVQSLTDREKRIMERYSQLKH
jgi:membrane associated rhomboid family serine protease